MLPWGRIVSVVAIVVCLVVLLVATYAAYKRQRKRDVRRGVRALLWVIVPVALLVVLGVWVIVNPGDVSNWALLAAAVCLTVSGGAALLKAKSGQTLARFSGGPLGVCRTLVLLVLCSMLAFFALELPWNTLLFQMAPSLALVNVIILALFVVVAYFLGQQTGVLSGLVVVAAGCLGIAQHFVVEFKGASILPSDLMALGTAAAVSGGYDYQISTGVVMGMAAMGLGWAAAAWLGMPTRRPVYERRVMRFIRIGINVLAAFAVVVGGTVAFERVDFVRDLGLSNNYFSTKDIYQVQGFSASFAHLASTMRVEQPEGYTSSQAENLEAQYVAEYEQTRGAAQERLDAEHQFNETKPSIVAIMNESFTDLSIFDGLGVGYEGPVRFKSVSDALLMGSVTPSNYGGGTCNSEFQFLTGFSSAYLGAAVFPYTAFDLSGMPSLARQFSDLGYATTAIHPNLATNWNRNVALSALGFDSFLDIDDFGSDAETFHAGVSDAETYAKVLDILAKDESPQFIFDITMQNHGGYEMGNIPSDKLPTERYPGIDDATTAQVHEFIACIEESDRAFADFLEELKKLDRPVVVLMFGDHQPNFTRTLNDVFYPDESGLNHEARAYETPFCIWANYDVSGCAQDSETRSMGIHALGAVLFDVIGAPLSNLQKASMVGLSDTLGLNALGYSDLEGDWHPLDDPAVPQSVKDFEWMQYLEMIDRPGEKG